MTNTPAALCSNTMQVQNIKQETADVYTLELLCHDVYPYKPGQYALVQIKGDPSLLRAYTLSSSPGLSPCITLTIRHINNGIGSSWLTQQVKVGDTLWLSDAMGEFTCTDLDNNHYLMLAAGCGITPIISMTHWLLVNKTNAHITVIYHVKTTDEIIFAAKWQQLVAAYPNSLKFIIATTQKIYPGVLFGRLSPQQLQTEVPHLPNSTIMTCGPSDYMTHAEQICLDLAIPTQQFHKEQFHSSDECYSTTTTLAKISIKSQNRQFTSPVGTTLLYALEQQKIPIIAACRSGICGSCKTKIISGDYITIGHSTLTEQEIKSGYVLACSCQINGDLIIN